MIINHESSRGRVAGNREARAVLRSVSTARSRLGAWEFHGWPDTL